MKQRVYIETSVLSYLTSRPSKDKIVAAHQLVTKEWWKRQSSRFDLCVSEIVLREAARGDTKAAEKRLQIAATCIVLPLTDALLTVAEYFMDQGQMPKKSAEDILHIALATVHRVDYLLSWNSAHIANAEIQKKLSKIAEKLHYELPILCTPLELSGETYEERSTC